MINTRYPKKAFPSYKWAASVNIFPTFLEIHEAQHLPYLMFPTSWELPGVAWRDSVPRHIQTDALE